MRVEFSVDRSAWVTCARCGFYIGLPSRRNFARHDLFCPALPVEVRAELQAAVMDEFTREIEAATVASDLYPVHPLGQRSHPSNHAWILGTIR